MTLMEREDTENIKRKHWIELCGELALEDSMDPYYYYYYYYYYYLLHHLWLCSPARAMASSFTRFP
jgi:hypothetical protein